MTRTTQYSLHYSGYQAANVYGDVKDRKSLKERPIPLPDALL